MNCHFSVTFIKSLNQGSIKPCLKKYVTAEMAAYLKEGAYLFLEKMLMVVFVLGIENGRLLV